MSALEDFVIIDGVLKEYKGHDPEVMVPENVRIIGDGAFDRNYQLTQITLPDGVTSIGSYAFRNCGKLKDITLPGSVTSIGTGAFAYCSNLTGLTMQCGLQSIGDFAFACCKSMTEITIPDSVTRIGSRAVLNFETAEKIIIPTSVKTIDHYAFQGCKQLTDIFIPGSVTHIGDEAFSDCIRLKSVSISGSDTRIGKNPFLKCFNLTEISISGDIRKMDDIPQFNPEDYPEKDDLSAILAAAYPYYILYDGKNNSEKNYKTEAAESFCRLPECFAKKQRNWHNNEFEIRDFRFQNHTKQVNHIVVILEKITIIDRIKKDDITVTRLLDRFTPAQIQTFIDAAAETKAVNVLAALLEYKNITFPGLDPMKEFTLEW